MPELPREDTRHVRCDGAIIFGDLFGKLDERRTLVSFAVAVAVAAIGVLPATRRAQTVDVAIMLAADVSLRIDEEEFQLQRRGYAAAVTNPQFIDVSGAEAMTNKLLVEISQR